MCESEVASVPGCGECLRGRPGEVPEKEQLLGGWRPPGNCSRNQEDAEGQAAHQVPRPDPPPLFTSIPLFIPSTLLNGPRL